MPLLSLLVHLKNGEPLDTFLETIKVLKAILVVFPGPGGFREVLVGLAGSVGDLGGT